MPERLRILVDAVIQRNDSRGRRVVIQGAVVPMGQQVPSAGEVAAIDIESCPFDVRISTPVSASGADIEVAAIRRLLWDACRAALSHNEITGEVLMALHRRIWDLVTPGGVQAEARMEERASRRAMERAVERTDRQAMAQMAEREAEAQATAGDTGLVIDNTDEQRRMLEEQDDVATAAAFYGRNFTVTHELADRPSITDVPTAAVNQRPEQRIVGLGDASPSTPGIVGVDERGFSYAGSLTGRSSSARPSMTDVGRTAMNRREAVDRRREAVDRAEAHWPSPDFVLGQPEGTHERADNRAPRNIKLRDRAPEAGGGDSSPERNGEVE